MRTKTALVELLKESGDFRVLFKGCCDTSAYRLRSQSWQFKEELASRGHVAPLEAVQDGLFELARQVRPGSPGADFVTWAGLLCGDTLARLQEHYANLTPENKETVDLSAAWHHHGAIDEACQREDLAALKVALADYEREAAAIGADREKSGAA